ncbi:MAG: Cna B-type domain-containing protein, partial [Clostridia bacterium]|nr:Cna B-type domain-containing protein [Clostridia bacterium]
VTEGEGKLNVERKDSSDDPVIRNEWKMTTAGIVKVWQDAGYEDDRFTMEDLPRYITARYSTDDGTTWVECGNLADLRTEKGLSVTVSDWGAGMWFINVQNLPAYIDGQEAIWSFVEKLPEDSPYETAYGDGGGIFDPEASLTYAGPTNTGIYNIHDVEMTFEGTKTMEGREMTAADIFTFEITQQGTDNKWTVQNDADGKILFPTFTYGLSDVGTYTYTVKEIGTGINGVTLDTTEYTVTLNVLVMDGQLTVQSIGDANPEALNFVNKYEAVSEITFTGTKTMDGREMTAADIFTFEIREVDASGTVLKTWNAQNDETGKIAYPTIRYEQDDVGTHNYIIHETSDDKNGVHVDETEYTVTVTVTDDGSGKLTVTASGDDYTKLDFVNIYKAQATIQFGGTKTLNGRDLADSEFSFELAEASVNYTGFTKNDADGSYVFAPIFYTQKDAGKTFTYTVKEENTADSDIIYDDTVYTVTVTVIDNGDGTLTLETGGDDYTRLDFENTVKAYSLTLKKTDKLDSDKGLKDAVYGLYAEDDPDCQGTPVYTITTGEDGTGKVENMEKGTYWLKEITAPEGYDVDPTPVKVTVPAEDGSADTNLKVDVADYPLGKVKVLKAWAGDTEDRRPASITVQLLKNGQPEGNPIQLTAENNWTAVVENLQMYDPALSEPTPYAYTWTETVPAGYTQTGNVTETDENGVEVTTLTNTHYNASGSIQFAGVKTLTGRALAADEFSFELKNEDGTVIETVKNASDGSFAFTAIQYTLDDVGEYIYTVNEAKGTDSEITYDETIYTIKVTVADNGDGTLKVTADIDETALNFVNAYEKYEADGEIQFSGTKTLTGRDLAADEFSFELKNEDGTVIETVKNAADGSFVFTAIQYTLDDVGEYIYTVNEAKGTDSEITYDETIYTIKVTVA